MKKISYLLCVFLTYVSFVHSGHVNWTAPPTQLSSGSFNASNPQITVDGSGNLVSGWIENSLVHVRTKPVSGSWSADFTLSGTAASNLSIVTSSSGNSTAVWLENGVVKASTKTLAGNWTTVVSLSASGATSPVLAIDDGGNVIAGWVKGSAIETSVKLAGQNWQTKVSINSSSPSNPSVAIGGSGASARAVVVWQGVSSSQNVIFTSTKLLASSWTTAQVISNTAQLASQPKVAMDLNGNSVATWFAYDMTGSSFTDLTLQSAERPSSGAWSSPVKLSAVGQRDPSTLVSHIRFDSFGNAIAIWNISFDDETFNLQTAIKPVNGSWSEPTDLVSSNLYAYSGSIATTSAGNALGLYLFYNGSSLLIQSTESDINGFVNNQWSTPITLSVNTNNASPKVAAYLNGNTIYAAAVWINNNGVKNVIVGSTGSRTLILPPSGVTVTQSSHNFGVFSEYFNTVSWTASTDPSVVGYVIFRNGEYLARVDADVLSYEDNNRPQNGAVTYSIAAINDLQDQSAPVSQSFP